MLTSVGSALRKILSERKLIVISHNKVRNVPLGPKAQLFFGTLLIGFCAWTSYSTGIYLAYKKVLDAKDTEIERVSQRNEELVTQFALIQKDFKRLANGQTEGDRRKIYDGYIMKQYAKLDEDSDGSYLLERINFLESRINELENYQQSFLDQLGDRTFTKVETLRKVIDMTGLSANGFDVMRKAESAMHRTFDTHEENAGHQGGPFIGLGDEEARYDEKEVLDGLTELLALKEIYDVLPLVEPMDDARTTSGYGRRRDPINKRLAMHYGLDFAAAVDSKVYATGNGVVTFAGKKGAYGNLIEISHGHGIRTRYGHLKKILVSKGDEIQLGDPIGVQGSTGRSTGTHLHYEVRFKNRPLDPKNFLKAGHYAEEEKSL